MRFVIDLIAEAINNIFVGAELLFLNLGFLILIVILLYGFGVIIYSVIIAIYKRTKGEFHHFDDVFGAFWCFFFFKIFLSMISFFFLLEGEFLLVVVLISIVWGIHKFQDEFIL